ncbi:hypothetical protein [Herbiconiux ginsengi]|uniref:Uncharacterized protein n=1 Tax=Herbiconiux ginsengi TaxID=381665 RepID=A0A1H3TY50_9MICO|nr:hypothetical protein [Herbiconiux ginsengi]SDZ54605.1 hypothetical protein SAMN05216554_4556 [Herbiconiux ginsengi]
MPDFPSEHPQSAQSAQREPERAVRETAAWTVAVVARAIEDARTR